MEDVRAACKRTDATACCLDTLASCLCLWGQTEPSERGACGQTGTGWKLGGRPAPVQGACLSVQATRQAGMRLAVWYADDIATHCIIIMWYADDIPH